MHKIDFALCNYNHNEMMPTSLSELSTFDLQDIENITHNYPENEQSCDWSDNFSCYNEDKLNDSMNREKVLIDSLMPSLNVDENLKLILQDDLSLNFDSTFQEQNSVEDETVLNDMFLSTDRSDLLFAEHDRNDSADDRTLSDASPAEIDWENGLNFLDDLMFSSCSSCSSEENDKEKSSCGTDTFETFQQRNSPITLQSNLSMIFPQSCVIDDNPTVLNVTKSEVAESNGTQDHSIAGYLSPNLSKDEAKNSPPFFSGSLLTPTISSAASAYNCSNGTCVVCGDKARWQHYGVLACEGCKGFFKRSVQKDASYNCVNGNGNCLIDKKTRTHCSHCRYQKCITVGMIKNVVRKDETKRRKPSKMKKVNQSSSTSTSPLSEKTQSGSTFIVPTQIITLPESAVISNLGTFIFTVPISSKSIKEEK